MPVDLRLLWTAENRPAAIPDDRDPALTVVSGLLGDAGDAETLAALQSEYARAQADHRQRLHIEARRRNLGLDGPEVRAAAATISDGQARTYGLGTRGERVGSVEAVSGLEPVKAAATAILRRARFRPDTARVLIPRIAPALATMMLEDRWIELVSQAQHAQPDHWSSESSARLILEGSLQAEQEIYSVLKQFGGILDGPPEPQHAPL